MKSPRQHSKLAGAKLNAAVKRSSGQMLSGESTLHSRAWGIFQFARVCVISPKSVELFAPGHHVWVGENVTARTPIFCVVLKDGEYWEVEAEWPDGRLSQSTI